MQIVTKGWGFEKIIVNKKEYCGKILYFYKNKKFSWHYHKLKDETFFLYKGRVLLKYGIDKDINKATDLILKEGECFYIEPYLLHQIIALEDSEIIEFSTEHFDDDSYRIIKGD